MKKLALLSALLLGGCASMEATKTRIHHAKQAAQTEIIQLEQKPATFKERFKKFTGKLRWTH